MKKLITILFASLLFVSCVNKGESVAKLNGDEINLPPELKGLKVYFVGIGEGNGLYVGIMDGYNSVSIQSGAKYKVNSILLLPSGKSIDITSIITENDSIIVARKK